MATKKAGWVRAWGVMIESKFGVSGFDTLCKWAEPTKKGAMSDNSGRMLHPACYKPVPVEIREAKPKRKAGKSKCVPFENTCMPSFPALQEYGKPRAKRAGASGQRKGKRGGGR